MLIVHFICICVFIGNESFTIKSDGTSLSKELVQFTGNSGRLWEGGDFVMGEDGVKVFKDQVLNRFAKVIMEVK